MAIGIASMGIYLPEPRMTSSEIAEKAGLPADVIEHKMGIREKPIPAEDDHTVEMGVRAARQAIDKMRLDPKEIDLVIYIGEEHKEHPLWTAGIKLQYDVGAVNAWAFDTALRCGTTIMALKLAKDIMLADETLDTILLAGGYRNVDLINYDNPRTRFMYNLAAGGGAIILKKDYSENKLLGTHIITDSSFSEDVIVPAGGTKIPMSHEALKSGLYQLDVPDPQGMKERLDHKSMDHFVMCVEKALQKSGYTKKDVDYVAMVHMKRSAHQYVLNKLGIDQEKSIYLEDYGHIGQIDQILSLELAAEQGKLKNGDIVVLVAAGIGYAWGANVIRWGKTITEGGRS